MFRLPISPNAELRLLEERHAETVFSTVDRDREHLRVWLPWVDNTKTVDDTLAFIKLSLERFAHNEGIGAGIWCEGRFAGGIGTHKPDWLNRKVEVGYWLASDFEGRGLATQAARAVVCYAFEELGLNRVEIHCATGNTRSAAIPRRLGFTFEATLRAALLLHGEYHDMQVYGRLASDPLER
jgi:ribosomal-protein-serine acetyltransferase